MKQSVRSRVAVAGTVLVSAIAIGAWLQWDARPGTLYRDDQGVAHGSGTLQYKYRSGKVQLVEQYYRGKGVRSEWFRPDGSSILVTQWKDESGEGLYLREDGTIWARMQYVNGRWDGTATYYKRDGTVLGTAIGSKGVHVSGYSPSPGEREAQ